MSELQAAVLPPQIAKLAERNSCRRANAERLIEKCRPLSELTPLTIDGDLGEPSFYKLPWRIDSAQCGMRSREQFIEAVQAEGVSIDSGFRGFVRRSERRCRTVAPLIQCEAAVEKTVLLHHPVLLADATAIDRVAVAIEKVVTAFQSTPSHQST